MGTSQLSDGKITVIGKARDDAVDRSFGKKGLHSFFVHHIKGMHMESGCPQFRLQLLESLHVHITQVDFINYLRQQVD